MILHILQINQKNQQIRQKSQSLSKMTTGWVHIQSASNEQAVNVLRSKLEAERIPVLIVNKQDANYTFGDIELHVRGVDVVKAKQICNCAK